MKLPRRKAPMLSNRALKAEVAKLQKQLLAEREDRNADMRAANDALRIVCDERDQYRNRLYQASTDLQEQRANTHAKVTEAEDLVWWLLGGIAQLTTHTKTRLRDGKTRQLPQVPLNSFLDS